MELFLTNYSNEPIIKKVMETKLICPITKTDMEDPVICNKGYTFERVAIERWLEHSKTNPITRDYLDKSMLNPNRILKNIISKSDFDKNDWIKKETPRESVVKDSAYYAQLTIDESIANDWNRGYDGSEDDWNRIEEPDQIEEEPAIQEEPDTPIQEEPVTLINKIIRELEENLNLNGYCSGKITQEIGECMSIQHTIEGEKNKIDSVRAIVRFFATSHGLKFINDFSGFKETVKQKLIDFRYDDNLREAGVWWRNIFKTRMPLKEDYC